MALSSGTTLEQKVEQGPFEGKWTGVGAVVTRVPLASTHVSSSLCCGCPRAYCPPTQYGPCVGGTGGCQRLLSGWGGWARVKVPACAGRRAGTAGVDAQHRGGTDVLWEHRACATCFPADSATNPSTRGSLVVRQRWLPRLWKGKAAGYPWRTRAGRCRRSGVLLSSPARRPWPARSNS